MPQITVPDKIANLDRQFRDRRPVAAKLYLHDPSSCSQVDDNTIFKAKYKLSSTIGVPLSSIALAGSAQTGWSIKRNAEYAPNKSDIDFAIIDTGLFSNCLTEIVSLCRGYTDNTRFKSPDVAKTFRDNASKGILIPRLFPSSHLKRQWDDIKQTVTLLCAPIATDCSFFIYISEASFVSKQMGAVNYLRNLP